MNDVKKWLYLVALVLVVWATLFGFTWNGVHHGISCTSNRGVEVR